MNDERESLPQMIRQGQLVEEIARIIPLNKGKGAVPDGWTSLEFNVRSLSMCAEDEIWATLADGAVQKALAPSEVIELVQELREVMYSPGTGTWFSARWVLERANGDEYSARVSFNFDEEPAWDLHQEGKYYSIDLEDFPRSAENIPAWLQTKLDEGAEHSRQFEEKKRKQEERKRKKAEEKGGA